MSLPKIEQSTFSTNLPSNGKEIIYRPFLVKEEKILLVALQTEDPKQIIIAIKQILKNCIVSPEDTDVDDMAMCDMEHMFMQLRIHSISDILELRFSARDPNFTECAECLKTRKVEINLRDVKVKFDEKTSNKIEINENLGLVLKYPTFSAIEKISTIEKNDTLQILKLFWDCIDFIYDGEKNIDPKDYTEEEGQEFLETLPARSLEKIKNFFDTLPKLKHTLTIKCRSCEFSQEYKMEGLQDFFG